MALLNGSAAHEPGAKMIPAEYPKQNGIPKETAPVKDAPAVAKKPAVKAPQPLSKLAEPVDLDDYPENFWAHSDLSEEVLHVINRLARKRLDRELKIVRRDADIGDVMLLTEALRYWRKSNGGDRIQQGYLITSMIRAFGFHSRNTIRQENSKKHSAILSAGRRLREAGIPYIDDFKEVHRSDSQAEYAEDKRIRQAAKKAGAACIPFIKEKSK